MKKINSIQKNLNKGSRLFCSPLTAGLKWEHYFYAISCLDVISDELPLNCLTD